MSRAEELRAQARQLGEQIRELLEAADDAAATGGEPVDQEEINELVATAWTAWEELDDILSDSRGAILPTAYSTARPFEMPDDCDAFGHTSKVHDGLNVEIDAPAGARVTIHINDWPIVDRVIPI